MKRGFVDWMLVKFSILVLAVFLLVLFLSLVAFHFYFARYDKANKNLNNIAMVLNSACASPYNLTTYYEIEGDYLACKTEAGKYILKYALNKVQGKRYVICCFNATVTSFKRLKITKQGDEVEVYGVA